MIYGIFIFRRDLRLNDNHGLINLMKKCDKIIPVFFLDKYQIIKSDHNEHYFSNNVVQFLCESLVDLNNQLKNYNSKLFYFFGEPDKLLENIIKQLNNHKLIIGYNADYSTYSLKRDENIKNICKLYNIEVLETNTDYTLIPFEKLIKSNDEAFKQFSAFYKNSVKTKVSQVINNNYNNYVNEKFKLINQYNKNLNEFYEQNINIAQHGGRNEALNKLKLLDKFNNYNDMRDRLDYNTTNISAVLNFGCISIREAYKEIYNKLGKNNQLLKQLYWRDFFLTIIKYTPNANDHNKHMDERYDKIKWTNSKKDFIKLWNGNTGFLLIDAGINELKQSGFLHNRARMLLGYFWTKYLLINPLHPKYGSQVSFSKLLVDAIGPSQNLMNHRWIDELDFAGRRYAPKNIPLAGRPMDISNKMIKKFDPDCIYIKKWLPHLQNIPNKDLYNWNNKYINIHPPPMFDSKIKYSEWIDICKDI